MIEKYYLFTCQKELDKIEEIITSEGYEVVGGEKATFSEVKGTWRRNKNFLVHCFYNPILNKKEYQYTVIQVEKTRPNFKGFKITEI